MRRLILRGMIGSVLLISAGFVPASLAQEDETPLGWSHDLIGGLGFTQTEFENYAEGGESSLTWTLGLDYKALETRESRSGRPSWVCSLVKPGLAMEISARPRT